MDLTATEAAYLAGFIDGDGCIRVYPRTGRLSFGIAISVTQANREVLEWCQQVTGLGCITPHRPKTEQHAETWTWTCGSWATKKVAQDILPYLKLKREQAQLILDFPILRHGPGRQPLSKIGQAVAYRRSRELNRGKGSRWNLR